MKIKHKGQWVEVDEGLSTPFMVQQQQQMSRDTVFSPHLSTSVSRAKALELLPDLEKAATNKKLSRPDRIKLLRIMSLFYKTVYEVDKQLECAKQILKYSKAAPDWHYLGLSYLFAGATKEAVDCFERAANLPHNSPWIRVDYVWALFRTGRWEEVGRYYDRHSVKGVHDPQAIFKHWEGEVCDRAAMLASGGYGDIIFFARFIPIIAQRVKRLAFVVLKETGEPRVVGSVRCKGVPNSLRDLLQRQGYEVLDEDDIIGSSFPIPVINTDGSLIVHYLGLTPSSEELKSIPNWAADPELVERYKFLRSDKLAKPDKQSFGICWRAEAAEYGGDTPGLYRQLTTEQANKIIEDTKDRINWVSLQYQSSQIHESLQVPTINDWNDTAAIIANLDAVVSVDTSVMHLAAAMGKPTYALLGGQIDNKFPVGTVNPFYPSIKQIQRDGWGFDRVVEAVISELKAELKVEASQTAKQVATA